MHLPSPKAFGEAGGPSHDLHPNAIANGISS
jgi:hypothetical protein